ncbi:5-carboxymethyl-2-hydroxymuconate Delta-isomerase [Shewanella sp. 1_MG-2023]|uniref:5-carboxymethyl-2-hydroxymuconate Delta-isomerase n=1 Tax=unclassified Shewanella TaxID=196818 RepID=UPI000C8479EA|nr:MULTISPECIES: 5-carboxymethyl-2-hydroxymuconate Delta-isomerase [unclassified Shewanella]MDO6612336.1 5-carboxymethyl-2-hydroxymuconate Delta-isomerase [Shewanella sp. 7_MG-2023]MDO6772190.1 5-carboxymethyl-2-hydroxymuconate Delta-isomerase [Shewanella sp. 2_MG-2023]MDO6794096.1 5-carboxymethyl-2-hydroxymuconate Delta-isomerase [Shewanella sp. 1_MG-2023]PMG78190.1 5-carboxymethyl-2-hydroxymuconate isomerase [Shewanella sp. 10N.286.51.B7]
MPHCIIEHSTEIDGNLLVPLVHRGALTSNLFDPEGSDIKVRAIAYSHYQTGAVDINFIHVTLKILSGRDVEQKSKLTQLVLAQLKALSIKDCSISVEVDDIDRESYAKVVV